MAFDCVMAAAWAPSTQAAVTAGPDVEQHLTGRVGTLTSTAPGPPSRATVRVAGRDVRSDVGPGGQSVARSPTSRRLINALNGSGYRSRLGRR